jgi:hypothetical protein
MGNSGTGNQPNQQDFSSILASAHDRVLPPIHYYGGEMATGWRRFGGGGQFIKKPLTSRDT